MSTTTPFSIAVGLSIAMLLTFRGNMIELQGMWVIILFMLLISSVPILIGP